MKKKFVVAAILACCLSLGIGIVIGLGMGQNNLLGTAADSSIQVRAGNFIVDGQEVDMGALMMALNLESTQKLDEDITNQMEKIQERSDTLKEANDILAKMTKTKSERKEIDEEIYDFCGSHGITVVGTKGEKLTEEQWDTNIEMVKGYIDALNSESQLDMIRLQSLMDKRNQAYEMVSDMLQKDQKTKDSIVGNMR